MKKNSVYQYLGFAVVVIIINQLISNYGAVNNLFAGVYSIIRPIVIGAVLAYFIYPIVKILNTKIISKLINKELLSYYISITLSYLIISILIYSTYIYLKPIIFDTISSLTKINYEALYSNLQKEWTTLQLNYTFLESVEPINYLESGITKLVSFVSNTGYLKGIINITSSLYSWVMGFIISIYMIISREEMLRASDKFFSIIFKEKQYLITKRYFIYFEETFRKFFFGKLLDSLIIGIMALVGLYLLKIPFYFILAVVVGITNIIPYFGPFIGGVPVVFVTLFVTGDPIHALWSGLFILALQQFDGIYLGPKILGDSVGVSSVWVIIAIMIGGALAGVAGLLLCIPIAATIKKAFNEYYQYKNT